MKNGLQPHKVFLALLILLCSASSLMSQQSTTSKSTQDLSFLIGEWTITRTYNPDSDRERILEGTLICAESLDGKFVHCTYEINRPGKVRGLDEVYFNYNPIYNLYESLWLSSTWPIKVLMQGTLEKHADHLILSTTAQFQIENNVTEYVQDDLVTDPSEEMTYSFTRQTYIRTSESETKEWHHHMTEKAQRVDR